ncbi:heavy metal-associated domain-containing protein [Compostibacter hankyongensis]|uniref:HMA domain-containing protein n=1 Tax=Compostibacter hankyongensis TaxID=1007089 RepID=A0ABP8G359_9BACT
MKKIVLLITCLAVAGGVFAQAQKGIETLKIKTSIEPCPICKKRVEDYFKREPGITYLNVNTHTKLVTVKYYTDRNTAPNLRTAIANLGYDADTVTANADSYARLPPCCKKGGMAAMKKQRSQH